jgi:hypothetical protein
VLRELLGGASATLFRLVGKAFPRGAHDTRLVKYRMTFEFCRIIQITQNGNAQRLVELCWFDQDGNFSVPQPSTMPSQNLKFLHNDGF